MNLKIISLRLHVSPSIAGVHNTSVNAGINKAVMSWVEGGVLVSVETKNAQGNPFTQHVMIPYSNIVGVQVEPEAQPSSAKDARKTSSKD